MPIIKSAIKRMHQTAKRRERNIVTKKNLKAATKAFAAKPSAATLSDVQAQIDTAVKKNLMTKNTAARRKASFAKSAKNAGVKLEKTAAKKPAAVKKAAPAKKPVAKKAAVAKKPVAKKSAAKPTAKK